jgi:glycosyltransferase involved in cell wall biosynthesis
MAHALETLLEAADQVRHQAGGDRFRFILLGNGARKAHLLEKAKEMDLDNVIFIDSVPKEDVAKYWSLLDVSIIHLRKTPLFTTVIPSKLFECMGMGIPVLHGVMGESAKMVEKHGVGMLFEPENADALCRGLQTLAEDPDVYKKMTRNCLAAAPEYDRKNLAARMLAELETAVKK